MDYLTLLNKDYTLLGEIAERLPNITHDFLFENYISLMLDCTDILTKERPNNDEENVFVSYNVTPPFHVRYIVAVGNQTEYTKRIVDLSHRERFPTPTLFKKYRNLSRDIVEQYRNYGLNEWGYLSRGYSTCLYKKTAKLYVLYDDSDLLVLDALYKHNLSSNIIHVDYVSPYYTLKKRKQIAKESYEGMKLTIITPPSLTGVMKNTLDENGVDVATWHKLSKALKGNVSVRVNFRLGDNSSNALKTILREMDNDVLPMRFNWSKDGSRVIGGTAMCPLSYLPRFDAKMKLLGKTYFNVAIDQENVIKKVFNEVTNDLQ